jgi:hypothetical protein
VRREGEIDVLEGAGLDHGDLAAVLLFGRGSDEEEFARQPVDHRRQTYRRRQRAAREQVVTAAVAQAGEGVVFGQKGDGGARSAAPLACLERRRQTAAAPLHLETVALTG